MKLVFIYGAPAAGKLTTAKELSVLTGYPVFHNHLSFDIGEALYQGDHEKMFSIADAVRVTVFEKAVELDTPGLIFTFVFAKDHDEEFVDNVVGIVEGNGGEVCFVQLKCEEKELKKRVLESSRKQTNKVQSIKTLQGILDKYDLATPVDSVKNLSIDNTSIPATDVAKKIQQHFELPSAS